MRKYANTSLYLPDKWKMSGQFLSKTGRLLRPNKCEGGPSTTMRNKPSLKFRVWREKNLGEATLTINGRKYRDTSTVYTLQFLYTLLQSRLEAGLGLLGSFDWEVSPSWLNWISLFSTTDCSLLMFLDKNWQEQTVVFNTFDFPQSEKPLSLPAPAF